MENKMEMEKDNTGMKGSLVALTIAYVILNICGEFTEGVALVALEGAQLLTLVFISSIGIFAYKSLREKINNQKDGIEDLGAFIIAHQVFSHCREFTEGGESVFLELAQILMLVFLGACLIIILYKEFRGRKSE